VYKRQDIKITNSNVYAGIPVQSNGNPKIYAVNTQFSATGTYCLNLPDGETGFHSCWLEGGSIKLDDGFHVFNSCHITSYIDSVDPAIVITDGCMLTYLRGDNVMLRNNQYGDCIYPITFDEPLSRQDEMTLAVDADALTGYAGQCDTYLKGFNLYLHSAYHAMLPRGAYLVTVWAKTDATVNNIKIKSIEKTSGGGNSTLSQITYALTTEYKPYRILHVIAAGDSTTYGSRLNVYKNSDNANTMSISHITVELLGEDMLYSGNPVLYSDELSDADGARESELSFIGRQSGREQSVLASVKAFHDGAADDQKGRIEVGVNDGDDGFAPTLAAYWDSLGDSYLTGNLAIGDNSDNDFSITFDGDTSDGVLNYDEDNADFEFDQDVTTTGALAGVSLNTGQGAYELFAMNQDVESTDAVTFATLDTGQGAYELFAMNQDVESTDEVTFASVTSGVVKLDSVTTTLSAAQVNGSRAAPVTVVAAQGANTWIELVSAVITYDFDTAAFTVAGDEDLVIEYADGTDASASIETTGFLDQGDDEIRFYPNVIAAGADLEASINQALRIFNTGAGETADGGASEVDVRITYRVYATGF